MKELQNVQNKIYLLEAEELGAEYQFYLGASGEIESRLVERRAEGSDQFPVDERINMRIEESLKTPNKSGLDYTSKLDSYLYKKAPREEPKKTGFLSRVKKRIGLAEEVANETENIWSYPEQLYDSAETSINVSKKPAGYNELKKRGEIKDNELIVDIGGGKFDNLVEDAAKEGATVKVYDPFNRTPEHNAAVVNEIKDGQADMAMSHNVLNVIQEDKNIINIARQAENAIKPNGKAHFSVYEGTGTGVGKVTTKGYQRNEKTKNY